MIFSFFKSLFSKKEEEKEIDPYPNMKERPFFFSRHSINSFFINAKDALDGLVQAQNTFWALLYDLNDVIRWTYLLIKKLDNEEDKAFVQKRLQKLVDFYSLAFKIRYELFHTLDFFEPTEEQIKMAQERIRDLEELEKFFKAKGLLEMPPPKEPVDWREKIIRGNPPPKNPYTAIEKKLFTTCRKYIDLCFLRKNALNKEEHIKIFPLLLKHLDTFMDSLYTICTKLDNTSDTSFIIEEMEK